MIRVAMCRYYFTYISESNMFYFFASFLCSARLSVLSVWCWDVTCVCNVCVLLCVGDIVNSLTAVWNDSKCECVSSNICYPPYTLRYSTQIPSSPHRKQIRYKHNIFVIFFSFSFFHSRRSSSLHWIFIIVCLFVFGVVCFFFLKFA